MARIPDLHHGRRGAHASKEVVAAAALAGAAAVGGKLVQDKRAESKREVDEAFRLFRDETIPEGIRRLAHGQLKQAHRALAGSPKRKLATAVHDTRKNLKRLRATVRLARGAIGDEVYRRENTTFRDAGRRLSGVRDASVLIETLDALVDDCGDDLPDGATARLRDQLEDERKHALKTLKADDELVAAIADDIKEGCTRTATWTFESEGFEAFDLGLHRIYARGRQALRVAQADPTDENLHEWRKRVKDLWHVEQILRPAAPKQMRKLAKRTHRLADVLGDDQDLAQLRRYIQRHPETVDGGASQAALMSVIERRRNKLQRHAFKSGEKLYARSPKRFVKAIARGWRKRVPPPAAATT